jgi:hypothetical protein
MLFNMSIFEREQQRNILLNMTCWKAYTSVESRKLFINSPEQLLKHPHLTFFELLTN